MATLSQEEIDQGLRRVSEWGLRDDAIGRTFMFEDFVEAMRFVNAVADLAERAGHHPDIDIRWNKVHLLLSTHSEGGLTEKDFALATRIDAVAAA